MELIYRGWWWITRQIYEIAKKVLCMWFKNRLEGRSRFKRVGLPWRRRWWRRKGLTWVFVLPCELHMLLYSNVIQWRDSEYDFPTRQSWCVVALATHIWLCPGMTLTNKHWRLLALLADTWVRTFLHRQNLSFNVNTIILAGTGTVSSGCLGLPSLSLYALQAASAILTFILVMVQYPAVQERARAEINQVVKDEMMPLPVKFWGDILPHH